MSAAPYLSIVVPAYNEARRLPPTLAKMGEYFRGFTRPFEVLIVVEQSTDGTLEIASEFARQQENFRVIDSGPQRGKGHAVRSGMLAAHGECVLYMDADLSVPLAAVDTFLAHFEQHPECEVILGNRQHAGSRITRRQSPFREQLGKTFNRVLQACDLASLYDTQCGFKAFRRQACHEIFTRQRLDGFAFDVEVLQLAHRLGYEISDLPVEWMNSPESKVRIVRDSLAMLWDTLRVRRLVAETLARTGPVEK